MNRIYIAGPMTGLPESNYPAFNAVAKQLSGMGFIALNPAENKGPTWADFMRQAIRQLSQAEGVFFLPGWEQSKGAQLEMTIAKALELPIICLPRRAEAGAQAQSEVQAKPLDPRAAKQELHSPTMQRIVDEAHRAQKQAEAADKAQKHEDAKRAFSEKVLSKGLEPADNPAQGLDIPKADPAFQPKAHHSRWQIEVYNPDDTWTTLGVTYASEMVSPLLKMLKNLYPRQDLYVKGYSY